MSTVEHYSDLMMGGRVEYRVDNPPRKYVVIEFLSADETGLDAQFHLPLGDARFLRDTLTALLRRHDPQGEEVPHEHD